MLNFKYMSKIIIPNKIVLNRKEINFADFSVEKLLDCESQIIKCSEKDDFMEVGIELLKDIAHTTLGVAGLQRINSKGQQRDWSKHEAILGGLLVRFCKLIRGYFDNACNREGEIVNILVRCILETGINIRYLIHFNDTSLYEDFIYYSLKKEKMFFDEINKNIKSRNGKDKHIERRMKASITKAIESSGYKVEEIKNKKTKWDKSIEQRMQEIGVQGAYNALIRIGSHAIHGNWQDLIHNNVYKKEESDEYIPEMRATRPDVQPLTTICLICSYTCQEYLSTFSPKYSDEKAIIDFLKDREHLVQKLVDKHEEYLGKTHPIK